MKFANAIQIPKELNLNQAVFDEETLHWITSENLWSIWVPKTYGGIELSLTEGLQTLQKLAKLDGSLGWTITLCSGANYFIGNLQKQTADKIFLNSDKPVCLGGSGGLFGTAEKQSDFYKISGTWRYGTGAPYLSHFTLNAKIIENGKEVFNEDGSPVFRSFVIPKDKVRILDDWYTMGLRATTTCSFEVIDEIVHKENSFIYNRFYQPQAIFKIHFSIFADLTLWVNYIGMAEHLLEEASAITTKEHLKTITEVLTKANREVTHFSTEIEEITRKSSDFDATYIEEIHRTASVSVKNISKAIVEIHPLLGIKAARKGHPINQIFCDYFTATQHHIFSRK